MNISEKTVIKIKLSSVHIVDETVTSCNTWFEHFKLNSNISLGNFPGILHARLLEVSFSLIIESKKSQSELSYKRM